MSHWLDLAIEYVLTLAAPLTDYRTLLLIVCAAALISAAVVGSAGPPAPEAAIADRHAKDLSDRSVVVLDAPGLGQ